MTEPIKQQPARDREGGPLLTVVVPVYNEAATLRTSVERLLKTDLPLPIDVVIVDDGSTDESTHTIEDLVRDGIVRLVRHESNRGKGAAVRTGIEQARGDFLTILDADLEYDPHDLAELLVPLVGGETRVTYGTRTFGGHAAYSFWYVLGNRFLALWASFLFNTWISDIETCFKVAETHLWRELDLRANGFDIEAEVTGKLLGAGHRIYEIPIRYKARSRQEGKKLTAADGLKAVWVLFRLRVRSSTT